jgi:formylglycine-generating enzyme required for sulfatase activity
MKGRFALLLALTACHAGGVAPDEGEPVGHGVGLTRVARGGSWDSEPIKLRHANRASESEDNVKPTLGLGLARTAE